MIFLIFDFLFLLFFEVVDKVFGLGQLLLLGLIKNGFLFEVNGRKGFILESLINFMAEIFPEERLIVFLVDVLTVVFCKVV